MHLLHMDDVYKCCPRQQCLRAANEPRCPRPVYHRLGRPSLAGITVRSNASGDPCRGSTSAPSRSSPPRFVAQSPFRTTSHLPKDPLPSRENSKSFPFQRVFFPFSRLVVEHSCPYVSCPCPRLSAVPRAMLPLVRWWPMLLATVVARGLGWFPSLTPGPRGPTHSIRQLRQKQTQPPTGGPWMAAATPPR